MSTNSVDQVGGAGTYKIVPPILIVAEKNPVIRATLLAADRNSNNNGLIDNSGELQAAVTSLQKTLSDTEFEQFVNRVVAKIKIDEPAPAAKSLEEVIIKPSEMPLPYTFADENGKKIFDVKTPFQKFDVTKGILWTFDRNQLTAEGKGNITGKNPNVARFISAPINTKGAKNIVATVLKMTQKSHLDGTNSGVTINFPWNNSPNIITYPWLPKFEGHEWEFTKDHEDMLVTNLKEGDRLVRPLGGREKIRLFVMAFLDKGESITLKVELE